MNELERTIRVNQLIQILKPYMPPPKPVGVNIVISADSPNFDENFGVLREFSSSWSNGTSAARWRWQTGYGQIGVGVGWIMPAYIFEGPIIKVINLEHIIDGQALVYQHERRGP